MTKRGLAVIALVFLVIGVLKAVTSMPGGGSTPSGVALLNQTQTFTGQNIFTNPPLTAFQVIGGNNEPGASHKAVQVWISTNLNHAFSVNLNPSRGHSILRAYGAGPRKMIFNTNVNYSEDGDFSIDENGNVGVNTSTPGAKFHGQWDAGTIGSIVKFSTGSTDLFEVNGSSNVSRTNFYGLATNYQPGGGSWTDSSDWRLKKEIEDIPDALVRILALHGVTYEWIDPEKHGGLTGKRYGMIAQEVEGVMPQWVGESPEGFKTLRFQGFEALAVEAIRSLKERNDDLESRIEYLEELIKQGR